MRKRVLAILYPGCIFNEISLALELLAPNFEVIVATPDGLDHRASNGVVMRATISYAAASAVDLAAIVIPGGDPGSIKDDVNIDRIIQEAHGKNILLAAICAGPFVLAKAGVLRGRKIAHGYQKEQLDFLAKYFANVDLTSQQLVVDGAIVTAKPEAFIDFAVEIACRLNVVDPARSARLRDYYKGLLGRKLRPLALAVIRRENGQILVSRDRDQVKGETFYRPLGGGIEFGETGRDTVKREIFEELGLESEVGHLIGSVENIFTFEGNPGHEVILLYSAKLNDRKMYLQEEFTVRESGKPIQTAVWRTPLEIKAEGAKLYPEGGDDLWQGL